MSFENKTTIVEYYFLCVQVHCRIIVHYKHVTTTVFIIKCVHALHTLTIFIILELNLDFYFNKYKTEKVFSKFKIRNTFASKLMFIIMFYSILYLLFLELKYH